MKMVITVAIAVSLAPVSASAGDALIKKLNRTREATCFNHPNKKLCIEGINASMKLTKAVAGVAQACKEASTIDEEDRDYCLDAEEAVKWIDEN